MRGVLPWARFSIGRRFRDRHRLLTEKILVPVVVIVGLVSFTAYAEGVVTMLAAVAANLAASMVLAIQARA
jgi:hypothetical protein